ncbi:MAG TPA: hypothetical protein VEL79_17595 [Vicinamibacterales bacterium]|nr:hypothetical protein [Vicinamibacterales bacterium]
MKKIVIAGTLAAALAVGGSALAQQPTSKTPAQPPAGSTAQPPAAPAPKAAKKATAKRTVKGAGGNNASGTHTAPKDQPATTDDAKAPQAPMVLGMVRLSKGAKADGKELAPGSYQVRLTPDEAKPDAKGASPTLERWVEFVQKGQVKGREVVSIVPANEAKLVQKDTPPPSGGSKVEMLKGGDYYRVWINKGGNYYLVHLVP